MANWKATHAEKKQRECDISITTESEVRYETTRSDTRYENEMKNDTRHEIQSESDPRYKR